MLMDGYGFTATRKKSEFDSVRNSIIFEHQRPCLAGMSIYCTYNLSTGISGTHFTRRRSHRATYKGDACQGSELTCDMRVLFRRAVPLRGSRSSWKIW